MTTSASNPTLISSVPELKAFLSSIPPSCTLYLDLEGNNLSRHGTISLITILLHPQKTVHLIDVLTLGTTAFTTPSNNAKTLKSILEDLNIPKCIWDVRNDADALWAHYNINLAGITDIQLLENASRSDDKTYIRGLDKCIQHDLSLGFIERERWLRTKKDIKALMPFNIFGVRPMSDKTVQYCVGDVTHLPELYTVYLERINSEWLVKAMQESANRVLEAQSLGYEPQSPAKKLGPWGAGAGDEKKVVSMEEMLEMMDEQRMDDMQRDMLGFDDDVGYYDDWDDDWGGTNAADGAIDPEAFDSCWDRNS